MARRKYAQGTTVAQGKSRAQIETMLDGAGAGDIMCGRAGADFVILFSLGDLAVRITFPRTDDERETRRIWRSAYNFIKAKLDAVASGISTVEHEFMCWVVDPRTNLTIGDVIIPKLKELPRTSLRRLVPLFGDPEPAQEKHK